MRIIILSIFFFFAINLNAQNFKRDYHVQFYDGKFFGELLRDSLVLDVIRDYDERFLFLSIKTLEGHLDFYQYDTITYFSREKINNVIVNEGVFKADLTEILVDTIITYAPEAFEEDIRFISNHPLIKFGQWKETDEKGDLWQGTYWKNKRTGYWANLTINKQIKFKDDIFMGIARPTKTDIENHLDWLLEKKFYWVSKNGFNLRDSVDINAVHQLLKAYSKLERDTGTLDELPPEPKWRKLEFFELKKNGTVLFKKDWNVKKEKYKTVLKGKWKIEDSSLTFSFKEKETVKVSVSYLGKDFAQLLKV